MKTREALPPIIAIMMYLSFISVYYLPDSENKSGSEVTKIDKVSAKNQKPDVTYFGERFVMAKSFSKCMGIEFSIYNFSFSSERGVVTKINGTPVPDKCLSEYNKRKITFARIVNKAMH